MFCINKVWEDRKMKFLKKENKAVKIENRNEDRIEMKIRIMMFWKKEWGFEEYFMKKEV